MIEDKRGCIEYDETGSGPTIVLAPGSCSTGAAWRPIVSQWGEDRFRCVTTSLLGYGRTAERRTVLDVDMAHEAGMLEAVIRQAGGPVHLVGHSFGGLAALAVALRNRVPLRSLAILEAPALQLLPHLGEHWHYRDFREMTDIYFSAFRAGDRNAIEWMIDFYGGPGTFLSWPQRVRSYAMDTTGVNILDWATAFAFPLTPALLAQVAVPTLVVRGGASHPAMQRANDLLGRCIADAETVSIADAAHFMISTHAEALASVIAKHVARAELRADRPAPATSGGAFFTQPAT